MGIRCDIPLPDLIEQEAPGDVVMRLGKPEPLGPVNPGHPLCLQLKADDAYFYYHKMGRCRVSHGREIIGQPAPGSDIKDARWSGPDPGTFYFAPPAGLRYLARELREFRLRRGCLPG